MKKIIYTRPDGGVSVVHPAEGARLAHGVRSVDGKFERVGPTQPIDRFFRRWPVDGMVADWAETEDEFIARVAARSVPADATNVRVVDESEIPGDRVFRDAWKDAGGKLDVDFAKAQEITKERLRRERAPLLEVLDVQFMRAVETGADTTAIVAEKQRLRDLPALADSAGSLDQLKALKP
jgi:hypothetical protein